MKTILAIDPGASGGISIKHGGGAITCLPMPDTTTDLAAELRTLNGVADVEGYDVVAYVELVGGFVGKKQPGSAMFKFGKGCGVIEGILAAYGIRTIYVRPQEWQKHFSLGTAASCDSKTAWKNKLKAEAQRRFPELKVTLATADSLLILDYARAKEASL